MTRIKKLTLGLLACLMIAAVTISCSKKEEIGTIYGIVTDYATGGPVSNANVQLRPNGETTLTGSDGHYEFLDVPQGTYTIKVTKEGYSDLIDDFAIVVKGGKQTKRDVQIKKLPSSLKIYDDGSQEISVLDFGANEGVTQKTFQIFNGGSQSLNYVITKTANWISNISQSTGTIGVGVTYPIVVTINRELLADGNNTTILMITSSTEGGKELTVKARKGGSDSDLVVELPSANLMVQKEDLGCVNWSSAKLLCENSTVAEYSDWRLPTKEELMTLYSNREFIGGFKAEKYWSSSITSSPCFVNFSNGIYDSESSYNKNNVRAVRTLSVAVPSVSTITPSDVSTYSAEVGGNVTSEGGSDVTQRGICYGTSQNPTTSNYKVVNGYTGTGTFTCYLTGLTANTTYYARAFAINSGGTAYGEEVSFTTKAEFVELSSANLMVQTKDLGYVNWTSAKVMCQSSTVGNYNDWRLPTQAELMILYNNRNYIGGFTTSSSSYSYYWSSEVNASGYPLGVYFYDGSLFGATSSSKQCSVRAVRTLNGGGTTSVVPTVTTTTPSSVSANSATVGGNVTSDGGTNVITRGVCYGTSQNPTTSSQNVVSGAGTGTFTCNLTGLTANTTYYVRAYAINSVGTAYGEQKTFTTLSGGGTSTVAPTVTTTTPSSVSANSATVGGNVTSDGGANVITRGVCYGTSQNPTTSSQNVVSGAGTGTFTCNLTGLAANTTYYVRAYAINSAGTAYGEQKSFTTLNGGGGSGGGQTYFYDFESSPQDWQVIDADGDGYDWGRFYGTDENIGHNGSVYVMSSASYINDVGALYPDNYLVSPQRYSISNGAKISFYVSAMDADYPADHYGVAVATTTDPDSDNFVTIWEETVSAKVKSGGKVRGGNRTIGNWYLKTVDLSAYAGQTIWVAFRHFDCTDQYQVNIDDVKIVTGN